MLCIWSGSYVAGKLALRHIDPVSLAALRIELAALLMLTVYFSRPSRAPLRGRDVWTFAALGLFGVAINQGCFTSGLGFTSSSHAVIIVALDPIIILLFAGALKLESFTSAKIIGMIISFAGVLLLETERNAGPNGLHTNDALAFCGVIGFCTYTILGKRAAIRAFAEHYGAIDVNAFMTIAAGIILAPLAIHQGLTINWKSVGWVGWTGMSYMAIFGSVVSYTLFNWILRHMDASRIAAVNYLQVPVVILLAVAILGERPSAHLLSGAALVLLGVYLAERHTSTAPALPGD